MTQYIQVTTTVANRSDAERIARELIDRRLAACVQISGPIESVYRWRGEVETTEEWRCTIKTRRDYFDRIERVIRSLHPYEVPEILAVDILAGNADYLEWLDAELGLDES
jgi:periplasmic divalent cation tolerance protein